MQSLDLVRLLRADGEVISQVKHEVLSEDALHFVLLVSDLGSEVDPQEVTICGLVPDDDALQQLLEL